MRVKIETLHDEHVIVAESHGEQMVFSRKEAAVIARAVKILDDIDALNRGQDEE